MFHLCLSFVRLQNNTLWSSPISKDSSWLLVIFLFSLASLCLGKTKEKILCSQFRCLKRFLCINKKWCIQLVINIGVCVFNLLLAVHAILSKAFCKRIWVDFQFSDLGEYKNKNIFQENSQELCTNGEKICTFSLC